MEIDPISQGNAGSIYPFLKWAGGKRWLVKKHDSLFPNEFNRYIEPFLGSAVVFFHLQPKSALLSDSNAELINLYCCLRDAPNLVQEKLEIHSKNHSREYYYLIRSLKPDCRFEKASRTLYLNRTCWNALYRVNLKGEFNVPVGTKSSVLLKTDDFEGVSRLLANVDMRACDFEASINEARKNDFVFVDPPYTVKHNLNGFVKYNEKIFSWEDQLRLRNVVDNAVVRGAKVLVTNANHECVRDLYKDFISNELLRSSVISGKGNARGKCTELVIQCW